MGAGVAPQCSRNRCLARWTVRISHRGREGAAGRATRRKTWSRPRSEVFVPFTSEGRERRPPPSREGQLGRGILPSCHPRPDHPKVLEEEIGVRDDQRVWFSFLRASHSLRWAARSSPFCRPERERPVGERRNELRGLHCKGQAQWERELRERMSVEAMKVYHLTIQENGHSRRFVYEDRDQALARLADAIAAGLDARLDEV